LPSRWGVGLHVMKNCDPFVPGPVRSIDRVVSKKCRCRVWVRQSVDKYSSGQGKKRTRICHGQETIAIVFDLEVLVGKLFAIDALSTRPVAFCKVPSLQHKVLSS
jgi:hypothetical protein